MKPQISKRAYELYERQGHRDGQSVQNWDKAEQEIRATQAKAGTEAETKPATKAGPEPKAKAPPAPDANSKSEAKVELTPAAKVEPKPGTKVDAKPVASPESKPTPETGLAAEVKAPTMTETKAVPPSAVKAETIPEPNAKQPAEVSPQLVKKVHEFYEQLGREDVRAVEESDRANQKISEAETTN